MLKKIGDLALGSLAILAVAIVVGGVLGVLVMLLWNFTVSPLFELPKLNILQAIGLFVLSNLLFNFPNTAKASE